MVQVPETAIGYIAHDAGEDLASYKLDRADRTEAIVRSYFADIPIMIEVARCESTFRHDLADGTVLLGFVDSDDTGVMQINKRFHLSDAQARDLDLYDLYDNMAFARDLYERQGVQPWSASMPCWGNTLAANY